MGSAAHDEAVTKLMKGGIENWPKNLRDQGFDLDLAGATCDWPAVKEIWARRHVLVHNGSLADEKYLQRVPGATRGATLEVDDSYLRNAIDLLCGFILGAIMGAWDKISPGNRGYVLHLALAYAATAAGEQRWPLAETLNLLAARLMTIRSKPQCTASTAGWRAFAGAARSQFTLTSPDGPQQICRSDSGSRSTSCSETPKRRSRCCRISSNRARLGRAIWKPGPCSTPSATSQRFSCSCRADTRRSVTDGHCAWSREAELSPSQLYARYIAGLPEVEAELGGHSLMRHALLARHASTYVGPPCAPSASRRSHSDSVCVRHQRCYLP